mmetsp:Transcript_117932/g.306198  ORF Transcript_117932/g.306198 Transcript_117932/m.306198 type:complete len:230 (-) Transcript_117932:85-774(-)
MAVPPTMVNYGMAAIGPPRGQVNSLPKHVQSDLEIQQLCDKYQQQLAELNACHSLLTVDQERLASMLAPYVNQHGALVMEAPDPDVLLFKQGLDLRLLQFEEDCKRIAVTERQLQQKIDEATTDYEQAVHGIAMNSDSRIFKRLREQQRQIQLQQQEIDQTRYEKELLQEETRRLREMTHRNAAAEYSRRTDSEINPLPRLHQMYEANRVAPPMPDTDSAVIFSSGPSR